MRVALFVLLALVLIGANSADAFAQKVDGIVGREHATDRVVNVEREGLGIDSTKFRSYRNYQDLRANEVDTSWNEYERQESIPNFVDTYFNHF